MAPPRIRSLLTAAAFAGLIAATLVLAALHPAADPYALAGGAVRNAWTVPGVILDAVNAGVVEEIVVVAVPVLIGRRAGWHPAGIAALSMMLRWPFHIYHGTWSSLPWAAMWGGAHVLAFLYLRRLVPLVLYHGVRTPSRRQAPPAGHEHSLRPSPPDTCYCSASRFSGPSGTACAAPRPPPRWNATPPPPASSPTAEQRPAGHRRLGGRVLGYAPGWPPVCCTSSPPPLPEALRSACPSWSAPSTGWPRGLRAGQNVRGYRTTGPGGVVDAAATRSIW